MGMSEDKSFIYILHGCIIISIVIIPLKIFFKIELATENLIIPTSLFFEQSPITLQPKIWIFLKTMKGSSHLSKFQENDKVVSALRV